MKTQTKQGSCNYCLSFGIYAGFWDKGYRRTMERGTNGRPMHPNERVYQCDRCGKPANAPPPPLGKVITTK